MPTLTEVRPLPNHRLWLCYDDGEQGEVNLADMAGRGVFAAWNEPGVFEKVTVGTGGEAVWDCGVDLCPDMLYLRLTGNRRSRYFGILPRLPET